MFEIMGSIEVHVDTLKEAKRVLEALERLLEESDLPIVFDLSKPVESK